MSDVLLETEYKCGTCGAALAWPDNYEWSSEPDPSMAFHADNAEGADCANIRGDEPFNVVRVEWTEIGTSKGIARWSVAVYSGGLQFGGAEEGGWWFWAGELAEGTPVLQAPSEDEAYALAAILRESWPQGVDRTNVHPQDDDFEVEVFPGEVVPPHVPLVTPFYE